jgi:UDP-3-O-[3-hydroxymyristoyl] glucosamine N-acyltransferase
MPVQPCYSLAQLADFLSATLDERDNAGITITGIAALADAKKNHISFLAGSGFYKYLPQCQAGAVIMRESDAKRYSGVKLLVDNPYLAYARLSQLFAVSHDAERSVHPTAVLGEGVQLGQNVGVGAHAVIEAGATIADGVIIGAGSFVGRDAMIGADTRLAANVSICHGVTIGQHCLLHSHSVIGADGFGFAPDANKHWCKIHQLGGVVLGDHVEVGACATVDRGALGDTVLGDGVKIDNHVQIGHNCRIGSHTAIAACAGIAGSTTVGAHCTLAGAVGVVGHIEIVDNVHITAMTMVTKSILQAGSYSSGTSANPTHEWRKNAVRFNQLNDIALRLKVLECERNV